MSEFSVDESVESETNISQLKAEQELPMNKAQWKRLESLWWAAVFIWTGVVFIADSQRWLPKIGESDAWSWIFLGAGVLGLLSTCWRLLSIGTPDPTGSNYFWSLFFLIIGLGGFIGSGIAFSAALIVIGVSILVNILVRPA